MKKALADLEAQQKAYEDQCSDLADKAANGKSLVLRSKSANELAQLKNEGFFFFIFHF